MTDALFIIPEQRLHTLFSCNDRLMPGGNNMLDALKKLAKCLFKYL